MLALLAFPIAEIWLLIILGDLYGWWVMLYLVVMIVLGLQLIRNEKALITGHLMQSLIQQQSPFKALFGSARNIIAGILLIIPGVLTDVIAAILLLLPVKKPAISYNFSTSNSSTSRESVRTGEPEQVFETSRETAYQGRHYKKHQNKAANDNVIEGEFKRED